MFYNRYEAKMKAKACMRSAYPHPMLVTLIFVLATSVVSMIVIALIGNPFTLLMNDMLYSNDILGAYARVLTPGRMSVYYIVNIVLTLYMWVMAFGYTSYSLRLARGEQPGYSNLLDGFAVVGKALLVNFLSFLFASLWGLIGVGPFAICVIITITTENWAVFALGYVLLLVGLVFEIIASYRYRLAIYFLLDNPGMGAMESIRRSKQAMRGNKGKLFAQDWSFFGWLILTPFTLYILSLWLLPYMGAAEANFYDFVVHGEFGPTQPPLQQSGGGAKPPEDDRPELTF